jgi:hypothetical protein
MTFCSLDCDDTDRAELAAENRFDRKQRNALLANPDCRDPDHPGCECCDGDDD